MPRGYCFFEITIGGKPLKEPIIMELFDDITPKTCKNFRQLCLGNDGKKVEGTDIPMTYQKCSFHRVIAGFMIQGGDFTQHNGTGGVSIYGEKFEDENFTVPCDKPGLLAMANAGANTNGSQFFITVAPAPHLTGRHVVFGRVVRGMNSVRAIEHSETGANDRPVKDCVIAECGIMDNLPEEVPAADGDSLPDYPEDCTPALGDAQLLDAGESIRQVGNNYFKTGSYEAAEDKYTKAVRYIKKVSENAENTQTISEKLIACHNNTAMCAIKLNQWSVARAAASEVLRLDPGNAKALFRRGVAALAANDEESAIEDLTKAHESDPANGEIVAKLAQAKEAEKARKAKLAANLKKMFS